MSRVRAGIFSILIFTAFLHATGEKFLLWESFEEITPPGLPAGWTVENTNGDDKQWETKNYGGYKVRPKCVRYSAHSVNPANDWFFTPALALSPGIQYTLRFKYRVSSAPNPEKLAIWFGTAPASGSMTTQIFNRTNITDTLYRDTAVNFTVSSSGNYYIGFHCLSDANRRRLFVDDISLFCPETNLRVSIAMTKYRFTSQTPIYGLTDTMECVVLIENIGSSDLNLNQMLTVGERDDINTQISFILISPSGDTMPFVLLYEEAGDPKRSDFKILPPGRIMGKIFDFQVGFSFTQTGTYTVRALYRNYYKHPDGISVWRGRVLSDPITFSVQ